MRTLDIHTDEEVAEYLDSLKEKNISHIITKPYYCQYKDLIEQGIRPPLNKEPLPYPPFDYDLKPIPEKDVDHIILGDIFPDRWRSYQQQINLVYKALYSSDDEIPKPCWEMFTALETIAYFLSFHVFDEVNSHPKIIEWLKGSYLLGNPKYCCPPMFYLPLETPVIPWARFSELLIKPAVPVLEEYKKTLTPTRGEHGWLIRDIFLGEEALYKLTEPLHQELRRTVPQDIIDILVGNIDGELYLKRAVTSSFSRFYEEKPGTWDYEFFRWVKGQRDTCPDPAEYQTDKPTYLDDDEYDDDEEEPKPKPKAKAKPASKPAPKPSKPNKPNEPNNSQQTSLF